MSDIGLYNSGHFQPVDNRALFDAVCFAIRMLDAGQHSDARALLWNIADELRTDLAIVELLTVFDEKGIDHVCQ